MRRSRARPAARKCDIMAGLPLGRSLELPPTSRPAGAQVGVRAARAAANQRGLLAAGGEWRKI